MATTDVLPSRRSVPLLIVLAAGHDQQPELAATAFVYAQTARALEQSVEVHLTGRAVRLAFEGVADHLVTDPASDTRLLQHMQRAVQIGARIFVCSMAMASHHRGEPLLSIVSGRSGTTSVLGKMFAEDARVLVF
ncbi:MAG: hypothetical protein FJY35_00445 [Betaproteobacteria bacterium]|nr:hypothetical protein [Betaproteobacteria bacterium]